MIGLQYRQWVLQNLNRDITENSLFSNIFLDVQEEDIDSCINQSKPSQLELDPCNVVNSNTLGVGKPSCKKIGKKADNVRFGPPSPLTGRKQTFRKCPFLTVFFIFPYDEEEKDILTKAHNF